MMFNIYGGHYTCSEYMTRNPEPEPQGPPCGICGENSAVAREGSFHVCSQTCAYEAIRHADRQGGEDG